MRSSVRIFIHGYIHNSTELTRLASLGTGNCKMTFEEIWRKEVFPINNKITLNYFLGMMWSILQMLGDWGNLVILTEPGEVIKIDLGEDELDEFNLEF